MEAWLGQVIVLLVAGVVMWGIWRVSRPRPLFTVRITNGEPQAITGTVTPAFLQRVREVAVEHNLASGEVYGVVRGGGRISSKFSHHFPPAACQQLRNWWAASGWTVTPRRPNR